MKHYLLLDRTGSMERDGKMIETVNAINGYVETVAHDAATRDSRITLAVFDDPNGQLAFDILRDSCRARDWRPVKHHEAPPRGMTPLYDAIRRLFNLVISENPDKATIVILTDGDENQSKETTKAEAKRMIDGLKEKGYDVIFMGANFDNFTQAQGLGNSYGATIMATSGNYEATFKGLARRSVNYAATGVVSEFTDADRNVAQGGTQVPLGKKLGMGEFTISREGTVIRRG